MKPISPKIITSLLILMTMLVISACSIQTPDQTEGTPGNDSRNSNSGNIINDTDEQILVLASGLDTVWAMDFLPDGEIIFTERNGRVSILNNSEVISLGNIDVREQSEAGLLGLAVDPDFENTRHVFLYYSYDSGSQIRNRVSRFVLSGNQLINETILLDDIPGASNHDGGRMKFGPDGLLYVTTGDAANPDNSQNINSLAGKILRLNKDGTAPADNPFGNYVYSYGHRNPQGIAWSEDGQMYSSEHGPSSKDELNIIVPEGNYGWPNTCENVLEGETAPIRCYTEFTLAPSGIAYNNGSLYVGGLRGEQLRKITLDSSGRETISEEVILNNIGRIRDVVVHEGYLHISTSNRDGRSIARAGDDKLIRIKVD